MSVSLFDLVNKKKFPLYFSRKTAWLLFQKASSEIADLAARVPFTLQVCGRLTGVLISP
jgi:hypothetical protein